MVDFQLSEALPNISLELPNMVGKNGALLANIRPTMLGTGQDGVPWRGRLGELAVSEENVARC
jgi:hypothetical protein